jgi:hypothetical protein
LSLNFANREYKRLYKDFVFENSGNAVCPYFTVEFKKDKGSDDTATRDRRSSPQPLHTQAPIPSNH